MLRPASTTRTPRTGNWRSAARSSDVKTYAWVSEVFFQAFPDSAIRTEALIEAGNTAAWTWITSGTWQGVFAGLAPNGKAYTLHGCSLFEVVHERIMSQRAYWDRATWFRQLDIPL
jgi:steroid delta-isomerase-like uncharacterized protein